VRTWISEPKFAKKAAQKHYAMGYRRCLKNQSNFFFTVSTDNVRKRLALGKNTNWIVSSVTNKIMNFCEL
jgi:hypothetical protein